MLYAHTLAGHPKKDWQTLQEHLDNVGRLAADFASLFGAARTGATLGTHHDAGKATEGFQRRLEGGPRVDHSTAGAVLLGQRWEASPSRQTAALGTMLSRFLAYPILGHHGGLPDAGSEYGTGLDHRLAPGNIQKLPSWDPATIRRYFQALYSHPELLDEHAILQKMKLVTSSNAALDPRFYRIPKLDADFAEIDRTFQFIESQTDSVVIESQLPEELRTCLRNEQALPSRVFRRLQSYSVQVYRWEREAMEQAGRLECLHDCVYLLSGGLGYAEDTGLDVRMADGISSADLVF